MKEKIGLEWGAKMGPKVGLNEKKRPKNWAQNGPQMGRLVGWGRAAMWQPNGKKRKKRKKGPRNWAAIRPKNGWVGGWVGVPHGALSKFQKIKQKQKEKCGGGVAAPERTMWQISAQVWLVPLPLLPRRAVGRPSFHSRFRPSSATSRRNYLILF